MAHRTPHVPPLPIPQARPLDPRPDWVSEPADNRAPNTEEPANAPTAPIEFAAALLAGCLLGAIAFVAAISIGVRVPGLLP